MKDSTKIRLREAAAARHLKFLAEEEIERFNRKAFEERGEFLWCSWPYSERMLEVLIAASHSNTMACKEGLVTSKGPNGSMQSAADDLRRKGLLHPRETIEEFQPTELGWEMLEHFAKEKYTRIGEIPKSLEEEREVSMKKSVRNSTMIR